MLDRMVVVHDPLDAQVLTRTLGGSIQFPPFAPHQRPHTPHGAENPLTDAAPSARQTPRSCSSLFGISRKESHMAKKKAAKKKVAKKKTTRKKMNTRGCCRM